MVFSRYLPISILNGMPKCQDKNAKHTLTTAQVTQLCLGDDSGTECLQHFSLEKRAIALG